MLGVAGPVPVEIAGAMVVLGLASSLLALRRGGGSGTPKAGRRRGAAVAFGITLIAAAIEIAAYKNSFGQFDPIASALLPGYGAPTIAAGVLAGWILGPLALKAETRLDWFGLTFLVAIVAVLIGSVAVGLLTGVINGATVGNSSMPAPLQKSST